MVFQKDYFLVNLFWYWTPKVWTLMLATVLGFLWGLYPIPSDRVDPTTLPETLQQFSGAMRGGKAPPGHGNLTVHWQVSETGQAEGGKENITSERKNVLSLEKNLIRTAVSG